MALTGELAAPGAPAARRRRVPAAIDGIEVTSYTVPTEEPESDGTLEWDQTTAVVVRAFAADRCGIGYSYGDRAVAELIRSTLAAVAERGDPMAPAASWARMRRELRNAGQQGAGAMALSAVDIALWDLKGRLLELPLVQVLPRYWDAVPVYGSGGFTSYGEDRLRSQLSDWAGAGHRAVKMKVGREPEQDPARLAAARDAIGPDLGLMVDANGAYGSVGEALEWAARLREFNVVWLEEPLPNDDLAGLVEVRRRRPPQISIAGGEYSWSLFDAHRLLEAGAVDVLQADVTRCGGITELLRIDALCRAHGIRFSAHCVPAVSAHACCAMESLLHAEYFHDHVRVESLLFEGTLQPEGAQLRPDQSRPGLGLELSETARAYES